LSFFRRRAFRCPFVAAEGFDVLNEGIRFALVRDDKATEEEGIILPFEDDVLFRIGAVCFGFKIFESLFPSIRRGLRRGDRGDPS